MTNADRTMFRNAIRTIAKAALESDEALASILFAVCGAILSRQTYELGSVVNEWNKCVGMPEAARQLDEITSTN